MLLNIMLKFYISYSFNSSIKAFDSKVLGEKIILLGGFIF
jgi:hypothetical protein